MIGIELDRNCNDLLLKAAQAGLLLSITADTVIRRIADFCELMGAEVVPHGWKTGITSAVGRHFQAACPAAPVFEYVSPHVFDSPMRRELVSPEPAVVDGYMALPAGPGLGIELNEELVSS